MTLQATKLQLTNDYTETENERLKRQNAALQNTINELRKVGFDNTRVLEITKISENLAILLKTLGLTQDELAFIRSQTCFSDLTEKQGGQPAIDTKCLVWSLLNIRQNLTEVFGKLLTDKLFAENLELNHKVIDAELKRIYKKK